MAALRELDSERREVAEEAEAARLSEELVEMQRAEAAWQAERAAKKAAIEGWQRRQEACRAWTSFAPHTVAPSNCVRDSLPQAEAAALLAREEDNQALALEQYREEAELNAQRVLLRARPTPPAGAPTPPPANKTLPGRAAGGVPNGGVGREAARGRGGGRAPARGGAPSSAPRAHIHVF